MNLDTNTDSTNQPTSLQESQSSIVTDGLPASIAETVEQLSGVEKFKTSGGTEPSNFVPIEPEDLQEAGLAESDVEAIILKFINAYGPQHGRKISQHIKLPFGIVQLVLENLKNQNFVIHKSLAAVNDYVYELTEPGYDKTLRLSDICSYCGAAPVGFDKYVESVRAQTLRQHRLSVRNVSEAFKDLLMPRELLAQVGQAVNSGRSMLLYGESGNGKTSIASRCIDAYDSGIWIPRTLTIGGEIIRLYDPTVHEEMPLRQEDSILRKSVVDERWIRIKRPKIVVGGELTFAQLEISQNRFTGVLEAPIQLKSNNGCLVIDDFGRQRITITEFLNRWIMPLENRTDYVRLPNGRKVESPFEQMLIFSTNLEPESLGEDAFFRRIPYKIEIEKPSDSQFAELFSKEAQRGGFQVSPGIGEYLIQSLRQNQNELRYCFARDIVEQCKEFCEFHQQEKVLTRGMIDLAMHNYFAGI